MFWARVSGNIYSRQFGTSERRERCELVLSFFRLVVIFVPTLNGEQRAVDQVEGRVEGFVHEVEGPLFFAVFVIFLFWIADEIERLEGSRMGVVDFDGVDERCLIVVWLIDLDEQAIGQGFVGVLGKNVVGRIEGTVLRGAGEGIDSSSSAISLPEALASRLASSQPRRLKSQ